MRVVNWDFNIWIFNKIKAVVGAKTQTSLSYSLIRVWLAYNKISNECPSANDKAIPNSLIF